MNKKVRFLFYSGDGVFKNDHIFKEHGAIIDYLNRHGYDAKIVCVDHGQTVDAQKKLDKNIPIKYIRNRAILGGISLGLLGYLFSVKKLHILILTHFSPKTFIYALWYRLFNTKGRIYLKGDFDAQWFISNGQSFIGGSTLLQWIATPFVRRFFSLIDIITVETQEGVSALHSAYPWAKEKIHLLPNGFDSAFIEQKGLQASYEDKTNTIVSIGRLGTYQKNTERMLRLLEQTDLKDRKIYLIGSIAEEFRPTIDIYFERYPHLREKIIFTGAIYDREELFSYLHKAKLYLCSSRFEGFSLVFPELISQGCYLITTPVSGARDVTDDGIHGSMIENDDEFIHTLHRFISYDEYSRDLFDKIVTYAYKNFDREKNLKALEHLFHGKK